MSSDVVGAVKFCPHCEQTRDVSLFYAKSGRPGEHHSWCKTCHRTYYKAKGPEYNLKFQNRLREEKQEYVRKIKAQRGCSECGERRHPCLEYHHVDPKTKSGVVWKIANSNATYARIDAEIAKCIVLCSNCHRVHHHNERAAKKSARITLVA